MARKQELKRVIAKYARATIGRLLAIECEATNTLHDERQRVQNEVREALRVHAESCGVVFPRKSEPPRVTLTFGRNRRHDYRPYYNPAKDAKLLAATKWAKGAMAKKDTAIVKVVKGRDALLERLVYEKADDVATDVKRFCRMCDKIGT